MKLFFLRTGFAYMNHLNNKERTLITIKIYIQKHC